MAFYRELRSLALHYRDRLEARVAERDGGCLDISLDVGEVSIGCIRLGEEKHRFMIYTDYEHRIRGMDRQGELVPLPD